MTRYTLHVPELLNDRTPIHGWQIDRIEADIIAIAGGFTQTRGFGGWRGETRYYREPVRLYQIDSADDIGGRLRDLAADIARRLDQEAVYLTAQEIQTFLVTPAREEITV